MSLEEYLEGEKTRYAVMRAYEIMGEAERHLPDELKKANADVPWTTMAAMPNRIIHGYFGVDDSILFETIEQEPGPLLVRLEELARRYGTAQ